MHIWLQVCGSRLIKITSNGLVHSVQVKEKSLLRSTVPKLTQILEYTFQFQINNFPSPIVKIPGCSQPLQP
jgi:hypothetical protein